MIDGDLARKLGYAGVDLGVMEPADAEAFRPAKLTSIAYVEHDVQVAALMAQIVARAAEFVGRSGPLISDGAFG